MKPPINWTCLVSLAHRMGEGWGDGFLTLVPSVLVALVILLLAACERKSTSSSTAAVDPHLQTNGTIEVTARLVEIPEGAIFKRELYDYATVLKYEVLKVHRGEVKGDAIQEGKNTRTF